MQFFVHDLELTVELDHGGESVSREGPSEPQVAQLDAIAFVVLLYAGLGKARKLQKVLANLALPRRLECRRRLRLEVRAPQVWIEPVTGP